MTGAPATLVHSAVEGASCGNPARRSHLTVGRRTDEPHQRNVTSGVRKDHPAPAPKPTGQPTQAPSAQPTQAPTAQPTDGDYGNDPEPAAINALAVPHPYAKNMAVNGKLVFDAPGTPSKGPDDPTRHFTCSGTVVVDPAHPGKSNLVWTAGQCAHGGKGSTANSDIIFIPGYNTSGAVSGRKGADVWKWAPYGLWDGADYVTSPRWKAEGDAKSEAEAAQYDFAIVRVKPQNDTGKSLEETVGGAVPVWFDARATS
ncbi:hypothetical protein ACWC0C_46375 [Streptomyces sp. NPDC001709]